MAEHSQALLKKRVRSFEGQMAKKESDKRRNKTRINIAAAFTKWQNLKLRLDIRTDPEMATLLMDSLLGKYPSDSVPAKVRKTDQPSPILPSIKLESDRDVPLEDVMEDSEDQYVGFSKSHQIDGSVDKECTCAASRNRKRSLSVRPQSEERRTGLLNDDVWVNLGCLLPLFQECGRCRAVCTVNTQEDTSHFSIVQYCKACNHWVIWNSQPLKSTSTEDAEKKEDVQVPVSSPCDDRHDGRRKVAADSETEAWSEEHIVELEVNIESDVSDERPSCRLEEKGEEEEVKGEELVGQQSDERREDDVGQAEQHHTDVKEEKPMAESVGRTVEVNRENDKEGIDEVTEDDEEDDDDDDDEDDWSEEEEQQQEGESQTSNSDFEINKPIKSEPTMRNISLFENENEGVNTGVTGDEGWQMDDDGEEEEDELDEEDDEEDDDDIEHSWDPNFKKIKLIKNKHRMRQVFLRRYPQRLCPNCGVIYASQTHVCNDKKKFPCPKCGKLWVSELNVNAHIIHCKGSSFLCRFCLAPFATQVDKVNHERSHTASDKPFSCSKCPETFADFFTRNRHVKEHRLLTCQTCQKSFSVVHELRRHELSHLDDKPFKCQVCERAFAQAGQLKSHMRVHTGERPYKCQLCAMRFNHNVSLKTHIRRYHQNESHPVGPQSHPDSEQHRVTPRGPSSASDPREQGESAYIPSSEEGLDSCQEPQPSRGSTEPEVHSMTVQETWMGEEAESALEDQGGLTLQTRLEEREGGGNACDSRPKRKRQRSRWLDSDFE